MATLDTRGVDVGGLGGGGLCEDIRISIYTYTDWACTRSLCCSMYVVAKSLAWTSLAQSWIRAAACRGIVVA